MKPFEEICKNEELEGNYWRRYSNTFCTLACNGCDEKGGMQQSIGLIVTLRNWISLENICPGICTNC